MCQHLIVHFTVGWSFLFIIWSLYGLFLRAAKLNNADIHQKNISFRIRGKDHNQLRSTFLLKASQDFSSLFHFSWYIHVHACWHVYICFVCLCWVDLIKAFRFNLIDFPWTFTDNSCLITQRSESKWIKNSYM